MDLEGETPVCLETPSSEGTQTEAGAAALRRPGGRALGKTGPDPDGESRSDAALPARIPGDAPPSSGRGPTPAPGFSRGLGAWLCRRTRPGGAGGLRSQHWKENEVGISPPEISLLKNSHPKRPAPIKNVPENKIPDDKMLLI